MPLYPYSDMDLLRAASGHNLQKVKDIVESGDVNINTLCYSGRTPLMYAVEFGSYEIAAYLVSQKAEINLQDYSGAFTLHCAMNRHFDMRRGSIAKGSKGNPDERKTFDDFVKCLTLLLDNGADVNAQDKSGKGKRKGKTVLMLAVIYGYYDIAKLLLDYGADPLITDKNKFTALDFCEKHDDIRALLNEAVKANAKKNKPETITFADMINSNGELTRLGKDICGDTKKMLAVFKSPRLDYTEKRTLFRTIKNSLSEESKQKVLTAVGREIYKLKTNAEKSAKTR